MTTFPLLAMLGVKVQPPYPLVVSAPGPAASRSAAGTKKFVAIQIGGRSFMDEGVEKVLDVLSEKGGVNVLMPTVFTFGRGLAGRRPDAVADQERAGAAWLACAECPGPLAAAFGHGHLR